MRSRLRFGGTFALGQALGRGSIALATILLVRALSPAEYGDLAYALAFVAIAVAIADAGFSRLIVRDVARSADDRDVLVLELLRVRLLAIAAALAIAAVVAFAGALPLPAVEVVLVLSLLALEATAFGFENAAVGAERPWRFVAAQLAGAVVLIGAVTALLLGTASLASALAVFVAAAAVRVVVHLAAWVPRGLIHRRLSQIPVRRWLTDALPYLALAVIATAYYRVGIVILHAVRGSEETAPYAAAFRVVDAVALIGTIAFATISPSFSRAHRDRPEAIWSMYKAAMWRGLAFILPVGIGLALFAEPICGALFGLRYEQSAGESLRLLAPAIVLLILQGINAAVVLMSDERRAVLRLSAANLLVSVVLAWWLSAAHGAHGAAVAAALAEAASVVSFAVLIWLRHGRARPPAAAPAS